MKTVYLTFDDGPLGGTDDVISVLNDRGVKGTLFMVGDKREKGWGARVFNMARASSFVQIANHSYTHALIDGKLQYRLYYSSPRKVVEGFEKATEALKIKCKPISARLPGRNTWSIKGVERFDGDSGSTAKILRNRGYNIYGWDIEWYMKKGVPVETVDEMIEKVKKGFSDKKTEKEDKIIILMHDIMFRASKGNKKNLEAFIDGLKKEKYEFCFIRDY
ncbi:Peptidoglycan N-acetylglucosamine deacetylase [hydrothermal vent metagenome]|uniref:Peptidoglycan N-acetylglucosamine deacetylase n=1 Tax=hydrothermal vent metagenome TaxID=652676 RepID=A0A3B0XN97_9ZZZZ